MTSFNYIFHIEGKEKKNILSYFSYHSIEDEYILSIETTTMNR